MYNNQAPKYSAKESAVYLLSRRDHGTFELFQKLTQKGYETEDVEAAIQYCHDHHYLDDLRYAKSQVRQHIAKGHGKLRIKQELKVKRISESVAAEALSEENTDWFELAKKTAEKKFKGRRAEDQKEYAKQVRFLQYRGFDFEQINYALKDSE